MCDSELFHTISVIATYLGRFPSSHLVACMLSGGISPHQLEEASLRAELCRVESALVGKHLDDTSIYGSPDRMNIRGTEASRLLVNGDGPKAADNTQETPPPAGKETSYNLKWTITLITSCYTFLSAITSSVVSPTIPDIAADLAVTETFMQQMTITIFVIAYAVGPLFLGPLSEVYGRKIVLQLANVSFLAFNAACGASRSTGQLIAFRFLARLSGSAPMAVGGGVLADVWLPEQRRRAISIYSLMPILGLANCHGRRAATGNLTLHTAYDNGITLGQRLRIAHSRPFCLLFTQPIVQCLDIYMAFLYSLTYLVLSTFPGLWRVRYGFSESGSVLHYIAPGVSFFLGSQVNALSIDYVYARLKARSSTSVATPEFRVPLMIPGAFLVPIGLLIYGWSAERLVFWFWPDLGIAIESGGFGLPLFAPEMYEKSGYGWGNTLLATLGMVLGWPAPALLWKYGEWLRNRSQYATGEDGGEEAGRNNINSN
ncbi:major facilitator superfamily domain-containing protein [Bisporella sp. PMI_857]|nr:major facilitator superfamily domain-containing protein [Bisporella sp. PMI_857]